ncbi:nuclease-related domain-containing protein [Ectobacillus ponti]|uniref:NERD domain-containing protein n=1 Tax=Ectobacillus ponti TaxID=2961894 RepID=A0AA41X2N0_9BACI|nr:nuclease-related domain-containing protein [Ectobacillus ponti]MCP8967814.1 NERD domain-containing protein [Ectobacillus ponti]
MIQKKRTKPLKLLVLEAFMRRLPATHAKQQEAEAELAKVRAGYLGEHSLDFYLRLLPEQEYLILHDLRLLDRDYYFQMDTLILHSSMLLILEVKHISGELSFDQDFQQLIRSNEHGQEVFRDPVSQVDRQARQLMRWLQQHECKQVPVHDLVVLTNDRSLVRANPHDARMEKVIRSAGLLPHIERLSGGKALLSKRDMTGLAERLIQQHRPASYRVLEKFMVQPQELLAGVHCPQCKRMGMTQIKRIWRCLRCGHRSRDAHYESLQDYALLLKPQAGNKELRSFLGITCERLMLRMLDEMELPHTGNGRGRVYQIGAGMSGI